MDYLKIISHPATFNSPFNSMIVFGSRQILNSLCIKSNQCTVGDKLIIDLLCFSWLLLLCLAMLQTTSASNASRWFDASSAFDNGDGANVNGNENGQQQQPENVIHPTSLFNIGNNHNTSVLMADLLQKNFLIGMIDYAIEHDNHNTTTTEIQQKCYRELRQFLNDTAQQQLWTIKCRCKEKHNIC